MGREKKEERKIENGWIGILLQNVAKRRRLRTITIEKFRGTPFSSLTSGNRPLMVITCGCRALRILKTWLIPQAIRKSSFFSFV